MATYYSNVWNTTFNAVQNGLGFTLCGKVAIPAGTAPATGDILQLFRVRSGWGVTSVYLDNNDWGTDVPGTLGHYGVDDGAAIDADSVIADVDLEDAQQRLLANASNLTDATDEFNAPFGVVTEDAYFKVVIGTVSSGTSSGEKYLNFAATIVPYGSTKTVDFVYGSTSTVSGISATE